MQVPILNGLFADEAADFRTSYPRNMIPVPKNTDIAAGYLRPSDGIELFATGRGVDRGGINWNGVMYRAMGNKLVRVNANGSVDSLGTIAGTSATVTFDYSFDHLGIAAGGNLYYWNSSDGLVQVTDPDLGTVIDALWVDGYWMTTDGTSLVVTELNDPTSVNPLKYGSAEADPDAVVALKKIKREIYAVGRYTIEVLDNVGGNGFPFARVDGALVMRGSMGTHCTTIFMDKIAFLGSGRNEPPAIWLSANSQTAKLSTREIDTILLNYTTAELELVVIETQVDKNHMNLLVHLPDQTWVYDWNASQEVNEPVWYWLASSVVGNAQYRARNLVWCYDKWLAGDPTGVTIGHMVNSVSTHYGDVIGWEFSTGIAYNESMGAQFHELELVCLPGRVELGLDPVIWTSYSLDGENWSQEKSCSAGKRGDRLKRLTWIKQGDMRNWRIQKFRGTSDAHVSVTRLEAQIEALYA